MKTFEKFTPTCSNIYLIDENLCLGNSLDTINWNFSSLELSLSGLERYIDDWFNLYTTFIEYSAKWIDAATNIRSFSAKWVSMTNSVNTLSSYWDNVFTVFYPTIQIIGNWYSKSTEQQNKLVSDWLFFNFPPINYNSNQVIDVIVYLQETVPFTFLFNRSFDEPCTPTVGTIALSCTPCRLPYQPCNHHGGKAGYGKCTNAYQDCVKKNGIRSQYGTPQYRACSGSGGKLLKIGFEKTSNDTHVARTVKISFRVNKEIRQWEAL